MKTTLLSLSVFLLIPYVIWAQEPANYDWEGQLEINCANGEHSAMVSLPTPAPSRAKIYELMNVFFHASPNQDGDNEKVSLRIMGNLQYWGLLIQENEVRVDPSHSSKQANWKNCNLAWANPFMELRHTEWQQGGEENIFFDSAWGYARVHNKVSTPTIIGGD